MAGLTQLIDQALLIAFGVVILIHLVAIAIFKEVVIKEPRFVVLMFEIALIVVIIGVESFKLLGG